MKKSPLMQQSAIAALLAANACGPGTIAQSVRPEDPSSAAVGEKSCMVPEDPNSPLVVDWKGYQRQELELSMQNGVAVVAFDCDELRLLPRCHVDGNYEFRPTTNQKDFIRLRNLEEIRANLPTSGLSLGSDLEGGMKRGATLDITLQTVGRMLTSRSAISRELLRGECEGATHIVRGATVGAFSMNTNTSGQVGANMGPLAGNGSSEKTVSKSSGDMEACEIESSDGNPPAKCNTPVRLHLEAIDEGGARFKNDEKSVDNNSIVTAATANGLTVDQSQIDFGQLQEKRSYASQNPFALGLRGFYRWGNADGYTKPSMPGAMVVGQYNATDYLAVQLGVGLVQLRGTSNIGSEENHSDKQFAAMAGAVVTGPRDWIVTPVIELNAVAQGRGLGAEVAGGIEAFPSSPFDLRVLGGYGIYPTGKTPLLNKYGRPVEEYTVEGGAFMLQAGYTF